MSFRPSTRPSCPHPTSSTPFRSRSHRALLLSCSRLLSVPFLVIHQRSVFQQWCINLYLRAYYSWENPWPSVNTHLRHNGSDPSSRHLPFFFSGYLAATITSFLSRLSSKLWKQFLSQVLVSPARVVLATAILAGHVHIKTRVRKFRGCLRSIPEFRDRLIGDVD